MVGYLMIALTIHVRQVFGEWHLSAVLTEDYGAGLEPAKSTAVWQAPLTEPEWDSDALAAVLSALARWSGMTIEERSRQH